MFYKTGRTSFRCKECNKEFAMNAYGWCIMEQQILDLLYFIHWIKDHKIYPYSTVRVGLKRAGIFFLAIFVQIFFIIFRLVAVPIESLFKR